MFSGLFQVMWDPGFHGEQQKVHGRAARSYEKVARGAASGGTGKEQSTKANTTGRAQAGGNGGCRVGRPRAHPQSVVSALVCLDKALQSWRKSLATR